MKMVRDVITEFTSDSLASYGIIDRVAVIFLSTLHTKGIRSCTEGLVIPNGRPKYVKGMEPIVHPKMSANCSLRATSQLIGIIVDLWKFILSPMDEA